MFCVEDAVVTNPGVDQAATVCDRVGQSVRGLMNTSDDVMPHLSQEVAGCWQRIRPGDVTDDIVDRKLRETKAANWCRTARSLIPLSICGAGNCLDVACAIALWGCSAAANLLRRLIYVTVVEFGVRRYVNRWRRQQCMNGASINALQDDDGCWEQVVKCAQPHQQDASLLCCSDAAPLSDAVEVFVLANILRRPIVVLSTVTPSTSSDPSHSSSPSVEDSGGIYLPLLWKQDECVRYPLVLANVDGKFSPLIGGDGTSDMPSALDIVPLVTAQLEPLRVWFLLDDEEYEAYSLMQQYMSVTEVNLCQTESISMVLGARLKYQPLQDAVPLGSTETSRSATVRFADTLPAENVVSTGTTHRPASTPVDLSVTTTQCRHRNCTNFASSFIYPYCYEHIDQRIVENSLSAQTQQQMISAAPDTSMMSVGCKQAGCSNMCSVFVYPYCYEHIEAKIAEHHCGTGQLAEEYLTSVSPDDCICPGCSNRASVNTYPVCYQHLDFFSKQSLPAAATPEHAVGAELQQLSPVYDQMMTELENRTKGSAARCRSVHCDNYGNSRCEGFCHECYQMQQLTRRY